MSKICAELPHTKSGKVKIEQFMKLPILSEEAFKAIDKNRFASDFAVDSTQLFRCNQSFLALSLADFHSGDSTKLNKYVLTTFHFHQRWFHHQRGAEAGQPEELHERDQPG